MTRKPRVRLALLLALLFAVHAQAQTRDGNIGSGCAGDQDCVAGLFCLLADPVLGGVPGGLCTLPCVSDEECAAYSPATLCLGLCVERCEVGAPSAEGDLGKCHGRADMGCVGGLCADEACTLTMAACFSFCGTEHQCGEGLYCAQSVPSGCQLEPPAGDPPGTPCQAFSAADTCLGICDLDLDASYEIADPDIWVGVCEDACVVGAPDTCTSPGGSGLERACIRPRAEDELIGLPVGDGDFGVCVTLCDCTSDCRGDEVCLPWDPGGAYDTAGFCRHAPRPLGAPNCLDATASAAAGAAGAATSEGCEQGPVRACKLDGCLGTAECQPDGTYGDCRCLDDGGTAGAGSEATPSLANDDASGCGCRLASTQASARGVWLLFFLAITLGRRSVRRSSHLAGQWPARATPKRAR